MRLLMLTDEAGSDHVLPGLSLLPHIVGVLEVSQVGFVGMQHCDAVLIDARVDHPRMAALVRVLSVVAPRAPTLAVLTEPALGAVCSEWMVRDFLLSAAGPAEIDARLRLAASRGGGLPSAGVITQGALVINPNSYIARVRGRPLSLTYQEFELLHYLAGHSGVVFTRAELVAAAWHHEGFVRARTVDVCVRRLRAKLGPEHQRLIVSVRNVGYTFNPVSSARTAEGAGVHLGGFVAYRREHGRDGQPAATMAKFAVGEYGQDGDSQGSGGRFTA